MPTFLSTAFSALVLLADGMNTKDPLQFRDCSTAVRMDLSIEPREQTSPICITPELPTTLVFDASLQPGSVEIQPATSSLGVAQGDNFVTVYPKRSFLHGERVKLTVRFAQAAAPTGESFWLMGHVARGARQVEVFRHPRSADTLEKQAIETRREARSCQEEKARLLKEQTVPGGLVTIAWLDQQEQIKTIKDLLLPIPHSGNTLTTVTGTGYVHASQLVISLELTNPGSESWMAAGATLTNATGDQRELSVWQESAIPPESGRGFVFVGTASQPEQLACPCVLKLWDESGQRTVTHKNITFSQLVPRP